MTSPNGFVILTDSATATQQRAIKNVIATCGWWHHFPQAWLIRDVDGLWTSSTLVDAIAARCPGLKFYVLRATPGAEWGGYGSNKEAQWLRNNWR